MKKTTQPETHETKERIPVWLYPSTLESMDKTIEFANCKSRSEFIGNAIRYYGEYTLVQDSCGFLPSMLVSAIRGTLDDSENRVARLLFKLAVGGIHDDAGAGFRPGNHRIPGNMGRQKGADEYMKSKLKVCEAMFQTYPDMVDVDTMHEMLSGISKKLAYKLLSGGEIKSLKVG